MAKTTVTYNRSKAQWELRGEILELLESFPAGPKGKSQAQIRQLQIEHPAALKIAIKAEEEYPALNGRAIRGAQVLLAGITGNFGVRWYANSQHHLTRDVIYTIDSNDEAFGWHCTCNDWSHGFSHLASGAPTLELANGRDAIVCKHICAVWIHLRLAHDERARPWPPSCPTCGLEMHIKRQQNNGSGLPFFSCSNFPHCHGRAEFQPHPDDLQAAAGDGKEALYLSMERAQAAGLVAVAIGAQMRARQRRMEQYRERMAYDDIGNPDVYANASPTPRSQA